MDIRVTQPCAEEALQRSVAEKRPFVHPEFNSLRPSALFDGVDHKLVTALLAQCSSAQFQAASVIIDHDQTLGTLMVINRGFVDLTRVIGSRELAVLLLTRGDVILPAASILRQPCLLSARALARTTCCVLPMSAVHDTMQQSSRFTTNLLAITSAQWRMSVRHFLDLSSRTAAQRLAAFLLHLADLQSDTELPALPIAKRHVAARLGVTAETLSRTLQTLASNGLHLRGRTIIIKDRGQIEQFCGPDLYLDRDEREHGVFAF